MRCVVLSSVKRKETVKINGRPKTADGSASFYKAKGVRSEKKILPNVGGGGEKNHL